MSELLNDAASEESDDGWERDYTAMVVRAIRRCLRRSPGLTLEELARRCTESSGRKVTSASLTALFSGRRRSISVTEVMTFAAVLGVPPISLIVPVGDEETVEVQDGVLEDAWVAHKMFVGMPGEAWDGPSPLGLFGQPGSNGVGDAFVPFRRHDRLLSLVHTARRSFRDGQEIPPRDEQRLRDDLTALRQLRFEMRALGTIPPALPPSLRWLDDEPASGELLPFRGLVWGEDVEPPGFEPDSDYWRDQERGN